ncbi:uncharacterized protein LOC113231111 [Hyposmocoma kahamanoa]|uniref:uncharacterized protein LOC113231111 n=1 Tax=Hyposmocoma kahamanoa TaxID=1477025 RepID=UPI000E6D8332|nr:uncharacterized protein LOC113231111 [Hyposmocoma kahamanoa]
MHKVLSKIGIWKELMELRKDGRVKTRSSLVTLSLFLDEKELIRVGGRLQHVSVPDTTKHPIIIPGKQHITKSIINEAHMKTLHGGIQLMMAYVRTKYWVSGLNQFMGQLPPARVSRNQAFINSGVDYAGSIWIRTSKGREHHATKGYICLFILPHKHSLLHFVDLLPEEVIVRTYGAINGTNFLGAARELKCLFEEGKNNMAREVAEVLANDGTKWHFISPRMLTCGGLWEAGVQYAKRHLTRVNKETRLTYEEMATLLAQIEACFTLASTLPN